MEGKTNMTREEWLNMQTLALRPLFQDAGFPLPDKIGVTCGWPSTKALGSRKRRIGECWNPECSKEGTTEIFISPLLDETMGVQGVVATLYHELIHAAVGTHHGHKGAFVKAAKKLGLTGPWTSTTAGPECLAKLATVLVPFEYPHSTLDATKVDKGKKQGTRMVKCECKDCGYTARTTRKWLTERGAPLCPCNGLAMTSPDVEPEMDEDGELAEAA